MAEATGRAPPALAARPRLRPWLHSAVEAFNLLSGSRGLGLAGPLPIPLSEIESYCRLFAVTDPQEAAELVELVQAMDAAYLEVAVGWGEARRETARQDGAEEEVPAGRVARRRGR